MGYRRMRVQTEDQNNLALGRFQVNPPALSHHQMAATGARSTERCLLALVITFVVRQRVQVGFCSLQSPRRVQFTTLQWRNARKKYQRSPTSRPTTTEATLTRHILRKRVKSQPGYRWLNRPRGGGGRRRKSAVSRRQPTRTLGGPTSCRVRTRFEQLFSGGTSSSTKLVECHGGRRLIHNIAVLSVRSGPTRWVHSNTGLNLGL